MLTVFGILLSFSGISNEQSSTKKIVTTSIDNLISIELDNYYTCKTEDLGNYELKCSHDYEEAVVGIINYDYNNYDTYEILNHHTNEFVKIFEEMEYRIKNKENNDKLNIVTISDNQTTYYIIVEVKKFNYALKTALVYLGTEKDEYKDIFSSAKYLKN